MAISRRNLLKAAAATALLMGGNRASTALGAEPPRADNLSLDALESTLARACKYFHDHVAQHGGYVYFVSEDLTRFFGEGEFDKDTIAVQPPGTPTVGEAYLAAFQATGDENYRRYAKSVADALLDGQLASGGWDQNIYFHPSAKRFGNYRNRPENKNPRESKAWNRSSLDDDQTQSAIRYLLQAEEADVIQHDYRSYGCVGAISSLCSTAMFQNIGGFPQVFDGNRPVEVATKKASYPTYDWKTERRIKNYWDYPTLNDGLALSVASTLRMAHYTWGPSDSEMFDALFSLGRFLELAQMPDPQPAWCQQYNEEMIPMWARKFEPPAIATSESQEAMRALMIIALVHSDERLLEPIPRALAYLKQHELPGGMLPRFIELKTDKPLYMTRDYELTYDDRNVPTHYGWKRKSELAEIEKELAECRKQIKELPYKADQPIVVNRTKVNRVRLAEAMQTCDEKGRWVSTYQGESLPGQPKLAKGFRYLSSDRFAKNVQQIAAAIRDIKTAK